MSSRRVAVIGGGPAGLMAADVLSDAGVAVTVYDRMPSVGRKFLMAGRGGLNLTHSEPLDLFLARYTASSDRIAGAISAFPPHAVRGFAHDLGQETFVGTSGRVFPKRFKASPLLRAWLARLRERHVTFETRQTLVDCDGHRPVLTDSRGATRIVETDATILALGGGSWPRLGSDGGWVPILAARGVEVAPLTPANCGVTIEWSDHFRAKFEGSALKRVAIASGSRRQRGEAIVTRHGLEGGAIYALSGTIRDAIAANGSADLDLDLRPDLSDEAVAQKLASGRAGDSRANALRKRLALPPVAIALLREGFGPEDLASRVKHVRLNVTGLAGLDRAISTAGGVRDEALDAHLMLHALPGVFVAGEMLDFDAPTGGYLLQAAFATGRAAALGALDFMGGSTAPRAHPRAQPA